MFSCAVRGKNKEKVPNLGSLGMFMVNKRDQIWLAVVHVLSMTLKCAWEDLLRIVCPRRSPIWIGLGVMVVKRETTFKGISLNHASGVSWVRSFFLLSYRMLPKESAHHWSAILWWFHCIIEEPWVWSGLCL